MTGNFAGETRIVFKPVSKALIRDVNEWNSAIGRKGGDDLIFLLFGQVCTGWIVTTSMQQDYIAGGNGFDIRQHGVKIHITCLGIKIAIFCQGHAKIFDDRRMVGPGRIGQPDRSCWRCDFHQLERLAHGSCAAGGGDG